MDATRPEMTTDRGRRAAPLGEYAQWPLVTQVVIQGQRVAMSIQAAPEGHAGATSTSRRKRWRHVAHPDAGMPTTMRRARLCLPRRKRRW